MKSTTEKIEWSHRYQKALRRFLFQEMAPSLKPALTLGSQAASLGMETLELAQIHERVLNAVLPQDMSSKFLKKTILKAKHYFNETNASIEKTHVVAVTKEEAVNQLAHALVKRTAESKESQQRLNKGIVNRKKAEAALQKSSADHNKLIHVSKRLHNLLRKQIRAIFMMQEKENKKISRGLQDKIAQVLLGINIQLLALKASDKDSATRFSKEIDSIKQFVTLNPNEF